MPFKFNPLTTQFDLVDGTGVQGPIGATDNAIARYDGTTGQIIQNSLAILQDGGGLQAQAFIFNREILNDVTIPNKHTVIASDLELISGDIIIEGDGTLILM